MSMLDMNTADKQRTFEPIPDGTFVKLLMQFKAGGASMGGCAPADTGLFKNSKNSDAITLECEFTVTDGPYAHRKWSEHWTVAGGKVDEKGVSKGWNMTRQRIRAMIESASNIKPDDESPEAKAGRVIPDFKSLDGIPFYAKLRIEEGEDYLDEETGQTKRGFDKNLIDRIVTPDMPEYAPMVKGEHVEPKPSGRAGRAKDKTTAAAGHEKPRWQRDAPVATEAPQQSLPGVADGAQAKVSDAKGPAWLRK